MSNTGKKASMSKVLRRFVSLFFLLTPLALYSAQTSAGDMLDSFLEWAGHPVLAEKRIVRIFAQEYMDDLQKEAEFKLELLLSNPPGNPAKFKQWNKQVRQELLELHRIGGIRYDFPEIGTNTILVEGETFPKDSYEFQIPNGKVEYYFKSSPSQSFDKWTEFKLEGSFILYTESGALLYYKEGQRFPIQNLDIGEIRSLYQTEKKRHSETAYFAENKTILFYFQNHNVFPFYALLISKFLLFVLAGIIIILYFNRFWTFLKDQTRRSHKAEISFLRKKEKANENYLSD